MRGVVWQLAGIVGLGLCVTFASTFASIVGPHVDIQEPLNHWVVLFGSYLFFSFLSFGVARMIEGVLKQTEMKEFDRHLGAMFGFIKGVAFCVVLTLDRKSVV